jgi:PAS domain S-box-containing protein
MKSLKKLINTNLDNFVQTATDCFLAHYNNFSETGKLKPVFYDLFGYIGSISLHEGSKHGADGLYQRLKKHIPEESEYNLRLEVLETIRSVLTNDIFNAFISNPPAQKKYFEFISQLTRKTSQISFYQYSKQQTKSKKKEQVLISDLTIVKNDLQTQLNVIYQLIKDAPIGMAACDENFFVEYWNPMATRLTGFHQSDILKKSFLNILSPGSREQFLSKLASVKKSIRRMKLDLQMRSGDRFPLWLSVSELKDVNNGKIRYVINFYDLKKEEKIRSQGEKIDQLGAIARLSGAIMHDIRNPINTIGLNLDLIEQYLNTSQKMSPEIFEILNKIHYQISQLAQNLNHYLGYAKLSDLNLEQVNLSKNLSEFVIDMRNQHGKDKVVINYIQPKKEINISCDWILLRRALLNLVQNSVEAFEDNGEITVALRINEQKALVSVSDNGPGIEKPAISKIYKPYYSTKNSGTGLGLFITREVVRAHGGRLYCSSKNGIGTKFTLSLPL